MRLRKNFLALFFQLGQGLGVDVFYFYGNDITFVAENGHLIISRQLPDHMLFGDVLTRSIDVRMKNMNIYVVIERALDGHSSQLTTPDDSQGSCLIGFLHLIRILD